MLSTLQNNCDRVKIACMAQLVNVIAPIMTENGGGAWKQTIFYPYMYASCYGRGEALKVETESDGYLSNEGWDVPYLHSSAVYNGERDELVIFAVNRSLNEDMELSFNIGGFEGYTLKEHIELYADDLDISNTAENEAVKPTSRAIESQHSATLKKHSWNMLVYQK